jgi:hypothetical protein
MTDYDRKGWVSAQEGEIWLKQWSPLITPKKICLFGGEPLLNREIRSWIINVRRHWPDTVIKVITNGFYLHKVPIIDWLVGPCELQVSLHFKDDVYKPKIISQLKKSLDTSNREFKTVPRQAKYEKLRFRSHNLDVIVAEFGEFRKPYKDYGESMLPAEGIPEISHSKCGSPNNPILYKNKLYKCGPIANLNDTLELLKIDDPQWKRYQSYSGISPVDDIDNFVNYINKPEWICSMCPDDNTELIDHYSQDSVMEKRKC